MSGVIRIILDYPGLSRFWIILDMFGYIRIIRVYGMEGAAAEEGEAQTRNIESSYRRCRRSRHDDRVTLDVEVGVQACRRLHFDESRRAEGAQPSLIEPQASPDLEQICRRVP